MSPLRTALFLEAILNTFVGLVLALAPNTTLFLLTSTAPAALTALFTRLLGIISLALAIPLALAYPNTQQARALRLPTYLLLGSMEVGWIATLAGSVLGTEETGVSDRAVWIGIAWLAGLLAWRVSVMWVYPAVVFAKLEWVGRCDEDMWDKIH